MTYLKTIVAAAGIAGAVVLGAAPLAFAEEGTNVSQDEVKTGTPVAKLLAMARDLVDYGRQNNDALSLIVAAQMRQQVSLKEVDRKPATEGSGDASPDTTPELTVDSILDEAKAMSGDDEVIAGLIDDVKASATKGRSSGPGYNVQTIPGASIDNYAGISFDGGKYAEVYAEGSGRTNLDLYIYDENGNLICSDTDGSDVAYCGWTPRWTGAFTIKVVNRGDASNRYALITN
jgi:hypothetical protein